MKATVALIATLVALSSATAATASSGSDFAAILAANEARYGRADAWAYRLAFFGAPSKAPGLTKEQRDEALSKPVEPNPNRTTG